MVLLWKDPEGKTVATIKKGSLPPPNSNSSAKDTEKIISLEKSIIDKDLMIAQLKNEIKTLKGVGLVTTEMHRISLLYFLHRLKMLLVQKYKDSSNRKGTRN